MYVPVWILIAAALWWGWYCWREQRDVNRIFRDREPRTEAEIKAELEAHERKYKHLY